MSDLSVLLSSFGVSGQSVWCRHISCVCALRQKTWRPAISEWFPFYLRKFSVWAVFCPGAHGPSQWTKFWLEPCLQTSAFLLSVTNRRVTGREALWYKSHLVARANPQRHVWFPSQNKRNFYWCTFLTSGFLNLHNIHVSLCIGSASWYQLSISMSFTFSRRTPCIPWNPTVKELG